MVPVTGQFRITYPVCACEWRPLQCGSSTCCTRWWREALPPHKVGRFVYIPSHFHLTLNVQTNRSDMWYLYTYNTWRKHTCIHVCKHYSGKCIYLFEWRTPVQNWIITCKYTQIYIIRLYKYDLPLYSFSNYTGMRYMEATIPSINFKNLSGCFKLYLNI